jgi:hypothetical protein
MYLKKKEKSGQEKREETKKKLKVVKKVFPKKRSKL